MGSTTLIILLVVGLNFLIVPVIIAAVVRTCWTPFVTAHPAVPPAEDAVRRNFQSYKIGLMNLGYMIHTAVDEQHLHLMPAKFGRMLGMKATSIPWEAIEPVRLRGKKFADVKIGNEAIIGPAWALGLAFDKFDSQDNDTE